MMHLEETMEELRNAFRSGRTKSAEWRKSQLRGLQKLLQEKEREIFKALEEDLGKHRNEAYRDEIGILEKSLNLSLSSLDQWMAGKKVRIPLIAFPTTGEIVPEPLGVVLIFSSWNFPFALSLDPLIGAIAAGNAVVLKPSELAPATSYFLAKNIPSYMDDRAIKIIEGGVPIAERLLEMKWDKIFFTGNARAARIILAAAAKHLTPVILELGGKSAAIYHHFSSARDRNVAIKRIVSGKWGPCSGQACIGVDYLLVEEKEASKVIETIKDWLMKFYGQNPQDSDSMSRIVNKHHFQRLKHLIEDPTVADSIVHGGFMDEKNLYIEPTILLDPPLNSDVMNEEIFGPILPIITLKKIEDSIEIINSRPQALALYLFTEDKTFQKRVIAETSSGSVTVNDTIIQFACDTLPFGGIGQSGFGRYHGKFSFDAFSHEKAVVRRSLITEFSFIYPPWNDYKLQFLRATFNFNYISLILLFLGLKRK